MTSAIFSRRPGEAVVELVKAGGAELGKGGGGRPEGAQGGGPDGARAEAALAAIERGLAARGRGRVARSSREGQNSGRQRTRMDEPPGGQVIELLRGGWPPEHCVAVRMPPEARDHVAMTTRLRRGVLENPA
jgi:hypothetical protein